MTNNVRLVLSVSEEDRSKLDKLSAELGMNRSQYVRYLLSGCSKLITPSMKYREFVKHFSQIDLSLRVIALKEEVSSEDMLFIESSIKLKEVSMEELVCFMKEQKGEFFVRVLLDSTEEGDEINAGAAGSCNNQIEKRCTDYVE